MKKKVILSAGGTGGHLFPAQILGQNLSEFDLLFVGGKLSQNRYFDRDKFPYAEITCATFGFSHPIKAVRGGLSILKGIRQSLRIIKKFKPDAVIGFGSYYTLPLLFAAKMRGIPIILHEQNAIPGKVNRLFSSSARATAITFPDSAKYLKGHTVAVAFPMRKSEKAHFDFGLQKGKPTLLVFGGSQGSSFLNRIMMECAPKLCGYQIIHMTGNQEDVQYVKQCYDSLGIQNYVKAFETHIVDAMKMTDFAITRAGAGTISELIEYEVPAILIPFPYAAENHQLKNAESFAGLVGGGQIFLENELDSPMLIEAIGAFSSNRMRRKIQEFKENTKLKHFHEFIKETLS